jgi:hypothetical protein
MFDGLEKPINFLIVSWFIMLIVAVPLGLWKLVEIIIWLTKHIHIV